MKYPIGTPVRIKPDLEEGNYYGAHFLDPYMARFVGKEGSIADVATFCYGIRFDGETSPIYWYTDEMVEPISDTDSIDDTIDEGTNFEDFFGF